LPIFPSNKAFDIARKVRESLNVQRAAAPEVEHHEDQGRNPEGLPRRPSERRKKLRSEVKSKKRERSQTKEELGLVQGGTERIEPRKKGTHSRRSSRWKGSLAPPRRARLRTSR